MSATVSPALSWLNGFDPTDPSTLSSLLNTSISDPSNNSVPAGFDVLQPTTPVVVPSLSTYQQALDAFQVTADTYLIQSALSGTALGPLSGTTGATDTSDLSNALQAAALAQQQDQQAQQQSALDAAQSALNAAQGINTTA